MKLLEIKNLHVKTQDNIEILKGINLTINSGDMLAILGPNGHGKSTLINAIIGNPNYIVSEGEILYKGEDLLKLSVDERARLGIFLCFQNPCEIPGVINAEFLKSAINEKSDKKISFYNFYKLLNESCEELNIPFEMTNRSLNEGFSGGEKKRNEILQMKILNPNFVMLDEVDSGLDVDAINLVSKEINKQREKGSTFLVVSHYARLFDLIKPNRTAVIVNGKVVLEGDEKLIEKIDKYGYEWMESELNISVKKEEDAPIVLGTCATKVIVNEK